MFETLQQISEYKSKMMRELTAGIISQGHYDDILDILESEETRIINSHFAKIEKSGVNPDRIIAN